MAATAALPAISAEEEAATKKNTDCVYFLASPLTCKKGSECEFRHSETARINPRDCWYWLAGNCLNRDCPFRHPPLDGRLGAAAPSAPSAPIAPTAQAPVGGKARVPCYFYGQGYCAKGDKCPFMHGSPAVHIPMLQKPAVKPSPIVNPEPVEKQILNADATVPKNPVPQMEVQEHMEKKLDKVPSPQIISRQEDGEVEISVFLENGLDRTKISDAAITVNNRQHARQSYLVERSQNGRETEERWEESSPGFDVLVDDGPEQLAYPEDADFGHDVPLETERGRPLTRGMHYHEDLDGFDYDYGDVYTQAAVFDSGGSYKHGYEHYDQLGYDRRYDHSEYDLANYEPTPPSYEHNYEREDYYDHIVQSQGRPYSDGPIDHGFQGLLEKELHASSNSGDLRNRLAKRRRLDQLQPKGSWRDRVASDFEQNRRFRDDHLKRKEYHGHGSRSGNRRSRERSTSEGRTRRMHEFPSDISDQSPGRYSSRNSRRARGFADNHHRGSRESEHVRPSKGTESSVHVERSSRPAFTPRRGETRQHSTEFAAPKSLAQIKAEKTEVSKPSVVKSETEEPNPVTSSEMVSIRQEFPEEEKMKSLGKEGQKGPTFEGPKPLSAILRQKRKSAADTDKSSQERRKNKLEPMSENCFSVEGSGKNSHGFVVEDIDTRIDIGLAKQPGDLETGSANEWTKETFRDTQPKTRHQNEHLNTVHGNGAEGKELALEDEEEDDFAKKLGGFFS